MGQTKLLDAPPPYTAHELPINAPRPLNLTQPANVPTSDQCIAHLRLLEAFYRLRRRVEDDVHDSAASSSNSPPAREKRWAVYVAKAVLRFYCWWNKCDVSGGGEKTMGELLLISKDWVRGAKLQIDESNLPPLDVIMVWHAYQLNPRNFLEDCLRFGKLRLWRTGMPWNVINSCIKGNDLELIVSETTKKRFEGVIGEPWEMEDMPDTLEILCPGCANSNRVQWTEVNSAVMTHVSGVLDSGFASNHFRATCERCTMEITHIKLREANIRRRIVAAYKTSHPMPGTVLDLNGVFSYGGIIQRKNLWSVNSKSLKKANDELFQKSNITDGEFEIDITGLKKVQRVAIRKMLANHSGTHYPFSLDLSGAVIRQGTFIKKMHDLSWLTSPTLPSMMTRSIQRYQNFILISADSLKTKNVAVPTLDIDLAWHTHQLSPPTYYTYTRQRTSRFLNHDDKIADTVLSNSFAWTAKAYANRFKEPYTLCLCTYCDAIRTAISPSSSLGRLLSPTHSSVQAQLTQLRNEKATETTDSTNLQDPYAGVHISTHNAISPSNSETYGRQRSQHHAWLNKAYKEAYSRASKDLAKRGDKTGSGNSDIAAAAALLSVTTVTTIPTTSTSSANGINTSAKSKGFSINDYRGVDMPFIPDSTITPALYAFNPVCGTLASDSGCVTGTCGGGVAIGSCGFKDSGAGGCVALGTVGGSGYQGGDGGDDGCGGCGGCG